MNALTRYDGTVTERALAVARLTEAELHREAMRAANERDVEALWRVVESYIVLKGRKKAATSATTLVAYRIGLERLLKHWSGENLLRPSRDAGDVYVAELQEGKHGDRPLDPGTIQVRLAAARTFYKALRWTGATEAHPFEDVAAPANPTAPEDRRTAYTEADVEKLLRVADELGAVIVTLGADGLRASEMLALRWSDLNLAGASLKVRSGKGGKKRTVALSADTVQALEEWKPISKGDRVFPFETTAAARVRIRNLCRLAGVQYLGLHSLRHYAGTSLYQDTGDLNVPRKQLGHASIATTTIYAKMDDRALKAALARRRRLLPTAEAA
jgi:integrase/recombinase XerC